MAPLSRAAQGGGLLMGLVFAGLIAGLNWWYRRSRHPTDRASRGIQVNPLLVFCQLCGYQGWHCADNGPPGFGHLCCAECWIAFQVALNETTKFWTCCPAQDGGHHWNFEWRTHCYKCDAPRTPAARVITVGRPTWTCRRHSYCGPIPQTYSICPFCAMDQGLQVRPRTFELSFGEWDRTTFPDDEYDEY